MGPFLVSLLLPLAVPAAKILTPIITALGSATLVSVFKIFLHGGLGVIDFMVDLGRATKVCEAIEADPYMTRWEKTSNIAEALLVAALDAGKKVTRDEAYFAATVLRQEFSKVLVVAEQQIGMKS